MLPAMIYDHTSSFVQRMIFHALRDCSFFNQINIVLERDLLENKLQLDAIWQTPRNGGQGMGLLVEEPFIEIPNPNSLQRNVVFGIVALGDEQMAFTPGIGSFTRAQTLATLALDFMHGWVIGQSSGLMPPARAVEPARDFTDLSAWRASVRVRREQSPLPRCDKPAFSFSPPSEGSGVGLVTLANGATTPDAEIYFTQQTPPAPGAPEEFACPSPTGGGERYTGPFPVQPGEVIQFAAWKNDYAPSHVGAQLIQ